MKCRYCHIPVVPTGKEQIAPRRSTGRWYALPLGDCPRCGTTVTLKGERELSDEEVEARRLPSLARLMRDDER